VTLTRDIVMPCGTDNATYHTEGLDTWHFFFFKNFLKKFKKKSKNPERDLIEALFQKLGCN